MSRVADEGRRREWGGRLEEWRARGETVAEFCRRHRVSAATFYYWKRRVAIPRVASSRAAAFLPVRVRSGVCGAIEIRLPNGVRVRLPADVAAGTLREAIQAAGLIGAGGSRCSA